MIFMFGVFFASLCSCPFPPICVGGQRFMLKRREDSVVSKLTEPVYINEKYFVEISDFALFVFKSVYLFSVLLLAYVFSTAVFHFVDMLYINGKITLYVLLNSLEYDENTSIIFRPNAKVMRCDLNLLFYVSVI